MKVRMPFHYQPYPAFKAEIPDGGDVRDVTPSIEVFWVRMLKGEEEPRQECNRDLIPELEFECGQITRDIWDNADPDADGYMLSFVHSLRIFLRGVFVVHFVLEIKREPPRPGPREIWSIGTREFSVTCAEFAFSEPGKSCFFRSIFHARRLSSVDDTGPVCLTTPPCLPPPCLLPLPLPYRFLPHHARCLPNPF
jgi:hypothetical protein